jgi:uncharacterized membrane protein YfcA
MNAMTMFAGLHSTPLAACVGLIGGISAGMFGVSPGGALVVFSNIFLGADQHVAQGISLAAQIPPTSLSGIKRYREEGHHAPVRWLVWLAAGFPLGSTIGALLAARVSSVVLQWSYVGYLVLLVALLMSRNARERPSAMNKPRVRVSAASLLAVGLLAGLSSGYLGIGGGLAIVAGLTAIARVPQHLAQLVSLVVALVPATLPAAYIYWRAGLLAPWPILIATILGLWGGTHLGALAATRMASRTLRRALIVMVTAMAAYMAWSASAL